MVVARPRATVTVAFEKRSAPCSAYLSTDGSASAREAVEFGLDFDFPVAACLAVIALSEHSKLEFVAAFDERRSRSASFLLSFVITRH